MKEECSWVHHLLPVVGSPKHGLREFLCKIRVIHEYRWRLRNVVRRYYGPLGGHIYQNKRVDMIRK